MSHEEKKSAEEIAREGAEDLFKGLEMRDEKLKEKIFQIEPSLATSIEIRREYITEVSEKRQKLIDKLMPEQAFFKITDKDLLDDAVKRIIKKL